MKRILILAVAAIMLLASAAMAQVPSEMKIVNCNEWVSLRAEPDSTAQRFAGVKLGETVRGFYGSNGDFTHCEYNGAVGYILNEYLEVMGGAKEVSCDTSAEPEYSFEMDGGSLKVWKSCGETSEVMYVARMNASGNEIWHYATESLGTTELSSVDAFVNAPANLVMVYNNDYGLIALDAETGMEKWTLPCGEVSLGGSIVTAVGDDGNMYIGGYYGPDPVGIDPEGKVLFQAAQDETYFYWMSSITIAPDGIAVVYDNGGEAVIATYDMQGKLIGHEPYSA